ncbi:hypothetical protein SAMN06265827_12853 [Orenia metallireducens]|uniref:Uncharacterized protein n=1 Tax=Orenia metallireducens TaxID=1413210 RepID=A0A285I344_9FIRM|nr:hypothetical protein [Orenia metallireducens]SNY41496.1 hypothetical protein SAMN06265827_12853 [Orenia metallireducens]
MLFFQKNKLPTDKQILEYIYKKYYGEFSSHSKENKIRESKIYVPIDIEEVANHFKVDNDIIFGRLYYHLENKYGYVNKNDSIVHFFAKDVGEDRHCINFPYIASILANLRYQDKKFKITQVLSIAALIISIISTIISSTN